MALKHELTDTIRRKTLENLSIVCRRSGEHDRSLEICCELMNFSEFSLVGYEGAAIYYEKVAGDLDEALRVTQEGINRLGDLEEKRRWRTRLRSRLMRLQQRVIRFVSLEREIPRIQKDAKDPDAIA